MGGGQLRPGSGGMGAHSSAWCRVRQLASALGCVYRSITSSLLVFPPFPFLPPTLLPSPFSLSLSPSLPLSLCFPPSFFLSFPPSLPQNPENLIATPLMYADAVWDRVALETDELSFRVGDVIEILDMTDDTWWQGSVRERSGWFPSSFVRVSHGDQH